MNIYLIGYRCTGKTTVGRHLSEKIRRPFIDTDSEVVARHHMPISDIVHQYGWDTFRDTECKVIRWVCGLDRHIVATGGGAVLNSENVTEMKRSGLVIWLKAATETIKKRLIADTHTDALRPSLLNKGSTEEIAEVLLQRTSYYETAKDFSVETDNRTVEDVSRLIIASLGDLG
jgi:shikimate kinase